MNIHKVYYVFQKRFRPKRMKYFYEVMEIKTHTKVLDVGGTLLNWTFVNFVPDLTILNLDPPSEKLSQGVKWVVGDARCMEFEDKSFDVVFSNSVLEHVGDYEDQKRFAEEVRRVGRRYFVQTPNYYFPIEPHLLTPFIHWLPRKYGKLVLPVCLRNIITFDIDETRQIFNEVRLLKPREMKELFPDSEIFYERVMGWPKSIIAIKR